MKTLKYLRYVFPSMDLQEVGCGYVDWIGLGWPRIGTGGGSLLVR